MFNGFALNNIQNCYIGGTAASAIYYGSVKIWPTGHDYSHDYLTVISLANNNDISWKASDASFTKTISVSTDGGSTWTSYTSSTAGTILATLNQGDELLIKGNNTTYAEAGVHSNNLLSTTQYNVQGNIMSLIYEDNFIGQTTLIDPLTFYMLFTNGVVNAGNLILPATTLTYACYDGMFFGCTALTTAPALPATTLVAECYNSMFYGCTSLTTAPALPATILANSCYLSMFKNCTLLVTPPALAATTLADDCYEGMFENCTSLTTAPELSASTLVDGCYCRMFYGCSALNGIKCLATDISAYNCTLDWVNGVSASGTFIKDATMSSWTTGNDGIPSGWTVTNA